MFSLFFNDIFCLLSRGSDSSQEKQTPTRTQHDILFLLQRRLTINFIPSPVRIAYFLFLSSHLLSSLSASSLTYPRDPRVIFRGSERTSGLFAGRISGSRHQISRFLGYIKRADPFPAMQRHKRIRPERYYPGKDVSWEFKAKWKWTWVCRRWLSSIISIEEILFYGHFSEKRHVLASQPSTYSLLSLFALCHVTFSGEILNWPETPAVLSQPPLGCTNKVESAVNDSRCFLKSLPL